MISMAHFSNSCFQKMSNSYEHGHAQTWVHPEAELYKNPLGSKQAYFFLSWSKILASAIKKPSSEASVRQTTC